MISKLYVDNVKGISQPICIDFISKGRSNSDLQYKVKDENIYINKIVGLLGGNASGKSSLIDSFIIFKSLLNCHILDQATKDEFLEFKSNHSHMSDDEQEYKLEMFREKLTRSIEIDFQNVTRRDEDSTFKVELYSDYIPQLTGFYSYELVVSGKENKIKSEKLLYRKKYRSKEKVIIDATDLLQSQVGYLYESFTNIENLSINFKNAIDNELKGIIDYVIVFKDEIDRSFRIFSDNQSALLQRTRLDNKIVTQFYEKYPDEFELLMLIIDSNIKHIEINNNTINKEINFYINDKDYLTVSDLSKGTIRMLGIMCGLIREIDEHFKTMNNRLCTTGIIAVDEIEQNIHLDLVKLIIGLFSDKSNKPRQLIFTTLSGDIFDLKNEDGINFIKQDATYVFKRDNDSNIILERLTEIKMKDRKNGRVSGDAVLGNLYRSKKLSYQPDLNKVNNFIKYFNNK